MARSPKRPSRAADDLAPTSVRLAPSLLLVGFALALCGIGGWLVSTSLERDPRASVLGGNLPINPGATAFADITAHNSPTLVRDPTSPDRLAVANRIDTPRYSCALNVSLDGGRRWSRTRLRVPDGEEPKCYAPDVAYGADGVLYASFVTLQGRGNVPSAAWLIRSQDAGRTFSKPRKVSGPLAFQVRLVADPVVKGRLYLTLLKAKEVGVLQFTEPGNPIRFQSSSDGGRTWTSPLQVNSRARGRVVAPSLAVGANGSLHVLYLDLGDDQLDYAGAHRGRGGPPYDGRWQLVSARSSDHGVTWTESVIDDAVVPTERFVVFIPKFPSLAADRARGRLYASYQDGRYGTSDVLLWASDDDGRSWSRPARVNDTPSHDRTVQTLPNLVVAANGRLDVAYYDRRADPKNVMTEVSLQSSHDRGASFTGRVRLSDQPFDSGIGLGGAAGLPDLGSRIGLISTTRSAMAVWSDTRAGTRASGKQDLALALVVFSKPERAPAAKAALRVGGTLALLVGLALIALWVRRRRDAPARAASDASDRGD